MDDTRATANRDRTQEVIKRPKRPEKGEVASFGAAAQTERFSMQRLMLRAKIHGAVITDTQLDYDGSITLDSDLLRRADMLPGEQVHVLNLNNGNRFITYTIAAPAGSGAVILNGPAARLGETGDRVIVLSYGMCDEAEARGLEPRIVRMGEGNQPRGGD